MAAAVRAPLHNTFTTATTMGAMRDKTVDAWLADLASDSPAPGGGAAAAMNAAAGAALVAMVCRFTIGRPAYAAHEQTMTEALARADTLRQEALSLAEQDAAAFGKVAAAYRLPKETDEAKRARTSAIQDALVGAADVPLRLAALAAEVVALARRILDGANVNVISDVAVAASSAQAALCAAAVNVEVNLATLRDTSLRSQLAAALAPHDWASSEAEAIVHTVRERIGR
jgi:formiminotetrahydrofolate cyclodeaminase